MKLQLQSEAGRSPPHLEWWQIGGQDEQLPAQLLDIELNFEHQNLVVHTMSGFEVAGVVLGGFPLLISALEHYRKGFEPILRYKRFRTVFLKFIDDVEREKVLFDEMLKRFLISTDVVDYDELQCFLTDSSYEGWKRKDLEQSLEQRLGPTLPVYMRTIRDMNAIVLELQDILSMKNGEVTWASKSSSSWDHQMKKIQLSVGGKGRRTLESLEYHNKKLRELLDSNEKLENVQVSRKDTSWANIFDAIRSHARSIHSAIKVSFCCNCSPHLAALRLEQRKTGDWTSTFNLAFSIPKDTKSQISYRRREVLLKIRENRSGLAIIKSNSSQTQSKSLENSLTTLRYNFESRSSPELSLAQLAPRPILPSSPSDSSTHSSRLKRIGRGILKSSHSSNKLSNEAGKSLGDNQTTEPEIKKVKQVKVLDSCSQGLTATPVLEVVPAPEDLCRKIENLCLTICEAKNDCGVLGYVSDGSKEHEIHQLSTDNKIDTESYVSLESLLSGQSSVTLNRQQRYKLASIVASSILQLQTTPWLADKFDKRSIFFHQQGNEVVTDYPYIKHSFSASEDTPKESKDTLSNTRFEIRDSFADLGILLLELLFGQTIEMQQWRKRYVDSEGKPDRNTDYLTARDWAEIVAGEEPAFEDVVRSCLSCWFEVKADWENKKFTQAVHAKVVAPLEKMSGKW